MTPHAQGPAGPGRLRVLSGLHEGAELDLQPGPCRVGSGLDAHVVLADPGLASVHFCIEIEAGQARVLAHAEGVRLGDAGSVGVGEDVLTALPVEIGIGDVRLLCERPGAPEPGAPTRRWFQNRMLRWTAACCLTAAAIAGGGTFLNAAAHTPPRAPAPAAPAHAQTSTPPALTEAYGASAPAEAGVASAAPSTRAASGTAPGGPVDAPGAAVLLRAQIEAAGLTGVAVAVQGDAVAARGSIPPDLAGHWQGVQEWFDRRSAGRIPLLNLVQTKVERPFALAVEGVWAGDVPNILVGGRKYLEGAVLPNGWTVQRIEARRVVLRREGRDVAVEF